MSSLTEQYAAQTAQQQRLEREVLSVYGDTSGEGVAQPAIFQRDRQIPLKLANSITHLKVSSGFMIYILENGSIHRINLLSNEEQKDVIELSRDDRVAELFMDLTGNHVVLTMESQSCFYLHRLSSKLKPLVKLTGIASIGWNSEAGKLHNTGPIIVGTSKGVLLETQLASNDDSAKFLTRRDVETYVKQLYDLGETIKVTGVAFGKINENKATSCPNYFIMVATSGRLYQFFGALSLVAENSVFSSIFEQYKDGKDVKYIAFPEETGCGELHLCQSSPKDPTYKFAWMTGPGVFTGNIDSTVCSNQDAFLLNQKLIQYDGGAVREQDKRRLGILLTQFHIIILYPDRMSALCMLNEKLVWEDSFGVQDKLLGMCRDATKEIIWVYSKKSVFKYKVTDESRDVWKIYLDMGEYDRARAHCKGDVDKVNLIYSKQADNLFANGQYDESAVCYALTRMSFEEVTLKFINAKQEGALKAYLEKRLFAYKPEEDKVQVTMLVTWLVEIWLNQLGRLNDQMSSDRPSDVKEERSIIQEEFRYFLANQHIRSCLRENKELIYSLIDSHGDREEMIAFAELMNDSERVISHRVQSKEFERALEELRRVGDHKLVYQFSPRLMEHVPAATVNMWIELSSNRTQPLQPKKLIPALVQYDMKRSGVDKKHEAIRYLEFCIKKLNVKDVAIHNYLISLYAEHDQDTLLKYLAVQGQVADDVHYDLKYALRLCTEKGLQKACVHIYSTMGLFSEAVSLALKVDLKLAKENANKPEDEEEKKKLWLTIARHVVEEEKNIDSAMAVLQECDLLKIEDILPFFPDFVTIDKFKDAICKSLSEYNKHIDSLTEDMKNATKCAEKIRNETQEFRKRSGTIQAGDRCELCNYTLLTRSFYLFPCQHKFHADCLTAEVLPSLPFHQRERLEKLQRNVARSEDTFSAKSSSSMSFSQNSAKVELDEQIASECIYCGMTIIGSVGRPFISPEDYPLEFNSWL